MIDLCFHSFLGADEGIDSPALFTYPFCYKPHPLVQIAKDIIVGHIDSDAQLKSILGKGKMIGALVVHGKEGRGFLAAVSGTQDGADYSYFVPQVYDYISPTGYFKTTEKYISGINKQIENLQNGEGLRKAVLDFDEQKKVWDDKIENFRKFQMEKKALRESRRESGCSEEEMEDMIRESQFQKAEMRRLKKAKNDSLEKLRENVETIKREIRCLSDERKRRSVELQKWLFSKFVICNGRGERTDIYSLFQDVKGCVPPSGSGECCAPKLLQYAFEHELCPVCMAEFWYGDSPKNELREAGNYYPSCTSKCGPVLGFMLQGLPVESNPLLERRSYSISVLYEDDWFLAVDKPAGLLSVSGKNGAEHVLSVLCSQGHDIRGVVPVHRLDMATSGVLLLAKSDKALACARRLFESRSVFKKYIAILDGVVNADRGIIDLPLCSDYDDRPRQKVDRENGKPSITEYCVVSSLNNETRIEYFPKTGRTHQLRVHSAHPDGLGVPIKGDLLYGRSSDRMYLHSAELSFIHPFSGKKVCIVSEVPF